MRQTQTLQTVERRESRDEAIVRLALEARRRGVRVYRQATMWFATSRSRPGTLHRVTGYSCDCAAFARHQRCTHNSALLDFMGWLPTVTPEPDPLVPPTSPGPSECGECLGSGFVRAYYSGGLNAWEASPCLDCDATGTRRYAA
jgi:hypothetical protein